MLVEIQKFAEHLIAKRVMVSVKNECLRICEAISLPLTVNLGDSIIREIHQLCITFKQSIGMIVYQLLKS